MKGKYKGKCKVRGFSLIEIIAVISILLVITLVSISGVTRMINKSEDVTLEMVTERIIDAAKLYSSSYDRNILSNLTSVGDESYVTTRALVTLGLVNQEEVDRLEKENIFVVIKLEEDNNLSYSIEHDESLIVGAPPTIMLIGDDPMYINFGSNFIDPGFFAFDANGENITSSVVVSGDTINTFVVGEYTIEYNVTDDEGISSDTVTRTVVVSG